MIILLILAAFIFIETPYGQNWIAKKVTAKFSKELKTQISFKHVSFSLFNKLNLEEFLLEDQQKDTLLYTGKFQVRVTDWFFWKDKIDLKYIGLENGVIKAQRTDSVWNYQFIVDYFSPSKKTTSTSKQGIELNIKKVELKNVLILQKDQWVGADMTAMLGALDLDADEINLNTKNINIKTLVIDKPYFAMNSYPGKRPPKKDTAAVSISSASNAQDTTLKWNAGGWNMFVGKLSITNGVFKDDRYTERAPLDYFDPKHIAFGSINATFTDLKWNKDTVTANTLLTTKERSGFEVKKMSTDLKLTPQGMYFSKLYLQTNNSLLKDYFSMSYDDISDLSNFLHKVKMNASFDAAELDSDDIAFFAPDLKTWEKNISISGNVRGTVDDITGSKLKISAGNNTYVDGDITLTGLPDINQTFIDFKSNDLRTNYADMTKFIPAVRNVTQPDLAQLGNIHFKGNFTGFIRDFVTFGTIQTNLGVIRSDLNMKLPTGKDPIYSGFIATDNFQLGRFIHDSKIGSISFTADVKGHGATMNTVGADLNAKINHVVYSGYRYSNITAKGNLEKKIFTGVGTINDPNLKANLNGLISINGANSKFDLLADIQKADLYKTGLTNQPLAFDGKFNLNFTGNNIDNFSGSARISNGNLYKGSERLSFDSLALTSVLENGEKTLNIASNEFEGYVKGDFQIAELPDAIQLFLNKYYPAYIKAPAKRPTNENFTFHLTTRDVDSYMQLVDKNMKGFSYSTIDGSINLAQNKLDLTADVPQFTYKNYIFSNTNIKAVGDLDALSLNGNIDNITVNDSINLPQTIFSVKARNDSSIIKIDATANQTVSQASLNATVITYNDGVKIGFDTSSFVLNGKTWTIDKNGELQIRGDADPIADLVLKESNQQIKVYTQPSNEGSGNDIYANLTDVNIGDIAPYFIIDPKLEGLISGKAKIEGLGKKLRVTGDLNTKYFRFNNDSIGELNLNDIVFDSRNSQLTGKLTNTDSSHRINADINLFLDGKNPDNLITLETYNYQLNFLQSFLGTLFSDINGYATTKMKIGGDFKNLSYVGKVKLKDAGLKLKFTQVYYKIKDTEIDLQENELELGKIKLIDTLTGNTATLRGSIQHDSWKNMFFDLEAKVDDKPITLLNTTEADNSSFYGLAYGTGNMQMIGPESDMYLGITGKASSVDSSFITIPPSVSKSGGLADFMVERLHGQNVQDSIHVNSTSKITYDINVSADPHTTIQVILDEITGDQIKGQGTGSLNIHSGTTEALTMNGNFNIEKGSYLFTFQSFFKRPFELRPGGDNYIKWNGDPTKATIHFDAQYKAEKVSFAPLASSLNINSDNRLQNTRDDVFVIVTMSGDLMQPKFDFRLDFPASSIAITDPTLAFNLERIQRNPNEINKQVTYLIVFNSFAPLDNSNFSGVLYELSYNTISSLLFTEVNRQLSSWLSKIFKDDKLKFNVTGSVYNRNPLKANSGGGFNINSSNINFNLSRSFLNDRLIVNFGSTLDVPITQDNTSSAQQRLQFLPDVNVELLLNKSGNIRATFFYRQNLSFLDPTLATNTGISTTKMNRFGAGLSYRKEFNNLSDIFKRKKKSEPVTPVKPDANKPNVDTTTVKEEVKTGSN